MAVTSKNIPTPMRSRGTIKLPQVVIEEGGLVKGSPMQVLYGKNYTAVVILPAGIKLEGRQAERIAIIVNEALG